MSILANLKTIPAYGLRYQLTFTGISKNKYGIRIYKKDYNGVVDTLLGTSDPLQMQRSFGDAGILTPVSGTQYIISFIAKKYFTYNELRQATSTDYYLVISKLAGTTHLEIGNGYYIPEMYEQKHGAINDTISLTFTDGLGLLRDLDFKNNDGSAIITRERRSDIITFLLNKIGSQSTWVDGIPLRPSGCQFPSRGMLYNTFIDCDRFEDSNCYDVLVDILDPTNSQIVQDGARFLIFNRDFPNTQQAAVYTAAGVYAYNTNVTALDYTIMEDGYVNGAADIRNEMAVRDITLKYKKELNTNLLARKPVYVTGPSGTGNWQTSIKDDVISMKPFASQIWNGRTPYTSIPFYREYPVTSGYFQIEFEVMPEAYAIPVVEYDIQLAFSIRKNATEVIYKNFWVPVNKWSVVKAVVYLGTTNNQNISVQFHTEQSSPILPTWGWIKYTKYTLQAVKNQEGTLYEELQNDNVVLDEGNTRQLVVEKNYGWESYPSGSVMGPYIWKNILFSKNSDGNFIMPIMYIWKHTGANIRLPDFIKTRLIEYYGFRKMRITLNVISKEYAYLDYLIKPYTQFIIEHLEQKFILGSYRWSAKKELYALELIGFMSSDWILETGYWNDKGVWIDTKFWED